MPLCPKCKSHVVITLEHEGVTYLQCRICHYDELEQDLEDQGRVSQREKGQYSPYKQGGKARVRKKK